MPENWINQFDSKISNYLTVLESALVSALKNTENN